MKVKTGKLYKKVQALLGISVLTLSICILHPFDNIDDRASAAITPVTSTVEYGTYYLSLSNNESINLNVNPTAAGAYAYATNDLTIRTNVDGGYDLYLASSSTTSAALTTTSGNTTIATTSGTGGSTGTPTTLTANSYGYALPSSLIGNNNFDASYAEPSASSKWAAIPVATSESSGDRIRSTNEQNTTGDHIDVHYGVFANNALAAGAYTGTIQYTAVVTAATSITATISPNSGHSVQTVTVTSGPLVANTTRLTGSDVSIKFQQNGVDIDTCTVTNVDTNNGYLVTTCTAPFLSIGSYDVAISVPRYSFTDTILNGYTATTPVLKDGLDMQDDLITTRCINTAPYSTTNTTYTLIDSRDDSVYNVRKLADGNCWMTQNLQLTGSRTLTSADSDVTSNFTLPASSTNWGHTIESSYGGGETVLSSGEVYSSDYYNACEAYYNRHGWYPGGVSSSYGCQYDDGDTCRAFSMTYYYLSDYSRYQSSDGSLEVEWEDYGYYSGTCTYRITSYDMGYYSVSSDEESSALYEDEYSITYDENDNYRSNVYYNWNTATAGALSSHSAMSEEDATTSICPKNWKLPTNGGYNYDSDTGDFGESPTHYQNLISSYGNTLATFTASPLSFTLTGTFYGYYDGDDGEIHDSSSKGYYWTATLGMETMEYNTYYEQYWNNAYTLALESNASVKTQPAYYGAPVRCLVITSQSN